MNASRMDLHSFSRTPFCRMMAKILVALMVFQTFPLWELSRSHQWSPEEFTQTVHGMMQLLGPGEAHAAPPVADAGGDRSLVKNRPGGSSVLLDGLASFDPDGDPLTYQWYGPFVTTSGATPAVIIPQGTYSISLAVDDGTGRSPVDTATLSITPCFGLTARAKSGKVQLVWTHQPGTERYDIFRAGEGAPQTLQKIGETTSAYSTYLDATVVNETTYVYVVAAVNAGAACYSGFACSHPTASRTASNYAPVITSSPIAIGTVGIPYNYQVVATDPNGDALQYALISAPAGMTLGSADGLIRWVPIEKGAFEVVARVDDGRGKEVTQTFTVMVVEVAVPNRTPIANTGPDQTVPVGSTPMLDGSKSTDADGDPLTYSWTLLFTPAGSTAALSDPAAMKPVFFVDKPGTYVAQLIVNDGKVDSAPDEVVVSTENSKPVADAGPDQTALVGSTVTLDGSKSSDVDGDPLTLTWTLTAVPSGSTAQLSDPAAVKPTFTIDKPGTYVVQLVVNDGTAASDPDSVTIITENSKPLANAGPDQTAHVGDTVTLDGSKSSDVDGNPLTFKWALIGQPAGSLAQLSIPGAVKPELSIDKPGTYVAQLIVNDGTVDSDPDTVIIITENSKPVADAGPDQTAHVGETVTLDGSKSSDVDGDLLTHKWSLTIVPAGSGAALSDPAALKPQFSIDKPGTYVAQLIVNDGTVDSDADTVTIITENSMPVANAGPAQTVRVGDTVTLDGSKSSDVDGDPLISKWSLTAVPTGSAAALSDPAAQQPTFFVDKPGTYVAQLIVNDGQVDSAPATVTISTINSRPAADAGPNQTVYVHETVILDGTGSSDADFDPLTYLWSFTTRPAGSSAAFSSNTAPQPSFDADREGTYVAQLIVNDGKENSSPDTVTITANVRMVTVPNLAGMTQANAEAAIVAAKLVVGIVTTANSSTVPPGSVISQNPTGGSSVPEGSPVALVVSLGPATVNVPNVVGMTQANAEAAIVAAGLTVGTITTASSSTVPAGSVVSQDPVAAASVPEGSAVALVISLGPVMVTVPNVVGMTQVNAEAAITVAGLTVGTISTEQSAAVPAGEVISQKPAGGASAVVGTAVDLVVSSGPPSQPADTLRPSVSLTATPAAVAIGGSTLLSVTVADDIGVVTSELTVNGDSLPLTPVGNHFEAAFSSPMPGVFRAVATARDAAGNEGCAETEIRFLTAGDTVAPTVALTAPAENALLTLPTNIVGTATDNLSLARYILQYSEKGKNQFITFASDTTPVVNGVLGSLDPTKLRNGIYDIRLTAEDSSGNTSSVIRAVELGGETKVGNFTIGFTDLEIPVAGIPITITRTYDSRVKTGGDFGIGWSIDIKNIQISESGVMGQDWNQAKTGGIIPTYYLQPAKPHTVTINRGDGQTDKFNMVLNPNSQSLYPFNLVWGTTASFTGDSGTFSTLAALANNDVGIDGPSVGPVRLVDSGDFYTTYDPNRYQFADPDGTVFIVNQISGLERITEPNGNSISFGYNGIIHSAGKSVVFTRDSQGRITAITDPKGNSINYEYDFYGDLVAVTDQEGNKTRYIYNSSHGLTNIIDPRGLTPVRNEYDADGRLTAVVDAGGNRVEFTHDVAGRQEIQRDREGHVTVFGYDANGNVVSETNALGDTETRTFDSNGNMLTNTDARGNTTTYTYDARGNVLTRKDAELNTTTYTYNSSNQILTLTDPNGKTLTNTYDAKGNLLTQTDPLGNQTTFTYDANGKLTSRKDANNNLTLYENDANGNLIKLTDPLGNITTYTYDANGNRLTVTQRRTDGAGSLVEVTIMREYDGRNRVIREVDPEGHATLYEYNAIGKQSAVIDKRGNRTTFEYDIFGNLTKTNYPDGTKEVSTYDRNGNRLTFTDRGEHSRAFEYDALGRPFKLTFADGSMTLNEYDMAGNLIATTDGNGNRSVFEYNKANRRSKSIDPLGNVSTFAYNNSALNDFDEEADLVSFTDANTHTTTFEYDAANRRTKTIFPDGTFKSVAYDGLGRKTSETDQAGRITRYEYDPLGRLARVTDAMLGTTTFTYDEVGNKLTQTDANGHLTSWTYDNMGRVLSHTLPLGMTETFTYDEAGNVYTHQDFNGKTTTYSYDANNRLTRKLLFDGSAVHFTYTPEGTTASVTDVRGVTLNVYDEADRLIRVENPEGSTIEYTYDAAGNRTATVTPSGTTTFTYDAAKRLQTVTDHDGGITSYAYDAVGNRTTIVYPNGTTTLYGYDTLNRLTRLENRQADTTLISSYNYTLAPAGNRTTVADDTGRITNYTYDDLYRLTREEIIDPISGNLTTGYSYDAVGNRLTKTDGSGVTVYTYDQNDRLLTDGTTAYGYDANGNTVEKYEGVVVMNYGYSPDNRLISAKAGGVETVYTYDADGNLIGTNVGGIVTRFLVDKNRELVQVLEERDGAGSLLAVYTHGDDLISQSRSGNVRYYHYDGLGSTRLLTDPTASVTDTYTYDAFGVLLQSTGTSNNRFLFAGEQLDPNTGYYYLRDRFYAQMTGRFITPDRYQGLEFEPMSLHKYLYASVDPVNRIDPSGRQFSLVSVCITASIVGILAGIGTYAFTGSIKAALLVGVSIFVLTFIAMGGIGLAVSAATGAGGAAAAGGGGAAITQTPRLLNPSTWQQAERLLGQVLQLSKNTVGRFVQGMSQTRIPDYVAPGRFIADSKFVQVLSSTAQIRDFVVLAQTWQVPLYIFVRQGTNVTGPVLQLIRNTGGDVIRIFM